MNNLEMLVYVDLEGEPRLLGRAWSNVSRNLRESMTFEYAPSWLRSGEAFRLPPEMEGEGRFFTGDGESLFGAFGDTAPDRWGRTLIERRAILEARKRGERPGRLFERDYMLAVSDPLRQGALRFAAVDERKRVEFLAPASEESIPRLVDLGRITQSAWRMSGGDSSLQEDLRELFVPGSSLGGSRPKANIRAENGELFIAKFPKQGDLRDVPAWEYIALETARACGLRVPEARLLPSPLENGRHILLVRRFDRRGVVRIPFVSAMTMLSASEGERRSYLDIAEVILRRSDAPDEDLKELWKRMVLNIMLSNTDDHLRNHGFLWSSAGESWRLSPLYDVEPVPAHIATLPATPVFDSGESSLEAAAETCEFFRIKAKEAGEILSEMLNAGARWRERAHRIGLPKEEIETMAEAFLCERR